MQMAGLFNKHIAPACKYCMHGKNCAGIEQTLCEKNGVVEPDYHCAAFRYDPLRRQPERTRPLDTYKRSDFQL